MSKSSRIRVKFVSHGRPALWLHQLPHGEPFLGNCHFLFDREERDYDWLVVYEHVSPAAGQRKNSAYERLACAREHTLFVTAEPSSIKFYGHDFTAQFGAILTSQEDWALPHPRRIHSQAGLHWFYGIAGPEPIPFDRIAANVPENKTHLLSMVYSPKRMRHTMHNQRNACMRRFVQQMPELTTFGRTMTPLRDKSAALNEFRYHIALENHIGEHHWTEKLADAFLGLTLPFYAGCPNASDYFPADSFVPIDMRDPDQAIETIRRAIADNEYEKRLPAIREARRRVLYEHNLFAVLSREIGRMHDETPASADALIYSRYALRRRRPGTRLADAFGKLHLRYLQWRRRQRN